MTTNLQRRIEALESSLTVDGVEVVFLYDENYRPLPDDEQTARLAAARARVGPAGRVIPVRLVQDWRKNAQPAATG